MENFILTAALPYANGNLHIGHIYEAVLADIKSRLYHKLSIPHTFVCGADSHGSATTIYCQQHNLDIETHLEKQRLRNKAVYEAFDVSFSFSKTNIQLHHFVVNECVDLIYENQGLLGDVFSHQDVLSWYDSASEQYLPDRYVKGGCPHCGALNQVEVCDKCQRLIDSKDLIEPKSVVSDRSVFLKSNKHLVLKTDGFYEFLEEKAQLIPEAIRDFVLNNPNKASFIDISREKPYYGIDVDKPYFDVKEQCYYVWFDAPIGYITFAYQEYLAKNGLSADSKTFRRFIQTVTFEHFIGKDIIYFHTFLWFNLLKLITLGKLPVRKINVHGWLVDKERKLSKSSGDCLEPNISKREVREYRLFFFSQYSGNQADVNYKIEDVKHIYENLILNKVGNFYSRVVKLAQKYPEIKLSPNPIPESWLQSIKDGNYKDVYESLETEISLLNSQFQEGAFWKVENPEIIVPALKAFLERWFPILDVLILVIPEFEHFREKALRLESFYLDIRVK